MMVIPQFENLNHRNTIIANKRTMREDRRIYVTHCSHRKNPVLMKNNKRVTPDKLYTTTPTQRFMNKCKNKGVNWAILSDKYGVWFSRSA